MDVRLAREYRSWMVALLPLTLGLGTLVLWVRASRWPRRLERDGVRLRNGRFVRWKEITRIGVTKREFDEETVNLDLYFADGSARVPVRHLQDGERIAAAVRRHYPRKCTDRKVSLSDTPGGIAALG